MQVFVQTCESFSYLMPQCYIVGLEFLSVISRGLFLRGAILNVTVLLDASISLAKPTLMVYLALGMLAVVTRYSLWRLVGLDASIVN